MLTMLPPLFAASMRRAASCAQKNTASRSVERMRRHSSSASSTARPACATPALLTRTVTVPKAFSAASKAPAMAWRSRTSADTVIALPPDLAICACSAVSRSARRATRTTQAPFAARVWAKRAPSPLDAPVTSATLPLRLNSSAAVIASPFVGWVERSETPSDLQNHRFRFAVRKSRRIKPMRQRRGKPRRKPQREQHSQLNKHKRDDAEINVARRHFRRRDAAQVEQCQTERRMHVRGLQIDRQHDAEPDRIDPRHL